MEPMTDETVAAASRRGAAKQAAYPGIVAVRYDRRIARIVIELDTGLALSFPPGKAQGLENARPADLAGAEISPSGLGVHFPKIDADLYLPGLIEGFLGSRRWIAALNGREGGKSATAAKAAAARQNGKLGGRPRKVPQPA